MKCTKTASGAWIYMKSQLRLPRMTTISRSIWAQWIWSLEVAILQSKSGKIAQSNKKTRTRKPNSRGSKTSKSWAIWFVRRISSLLLKWLSAWTSFVTSTTCLCELWRWKRKAKIKSTSTLKTRRSSSRLRAAASMRPSLYQPTRNCWGRSWVNCLRKTK